MIIMNAWVEVGKSFGELWTHDTVIEEVETVVDKQK